MHSSNSTFKYIGKPQLRTEDERLLRGRGRFTDDFCKPGQLYAAAVRSPHAHARIEKIDHSGAQAMPGVRLVLTGQAAMADGLGAIDHNPLPKTRFDMKLSGPKQSTVFVGPHVVLPTDKVRHVGEAVAFVVADTLGQALDAAEAVAVSYEELPAVIGIESALAAVTPPVWDEVADNVFVDTRFNDEQASDDAFAKAHLVVCGEYVIQRVTGVPLEPRCALGEFDANTRRYTLHAGSGGAVKQKSEISKVLGIDANDLRVLSYDVGGNFGTRNRTYVEFVLVLWAAAKLGRPVKFTATRSESFLSDYQGRDFFTRVSLAIDDKGKFLALRADNISNAGARCVSLSPLGKGSALITGSYDIPIACLRARAVFTNTPPTQAYRSSGRPEVTFAIERLIDKAALALNADPLQLRRQNLVAASAMPYTNAVGACYDSGDYAGNMDRIHALADWDGFAQRRGEAEARGMLLGRGFANYVESSIGSPYERAEITLHADNQVVVVIGTQPSGQGHETSFAQVAADLLQVEFHAIKVVYSDTDIVKLGGGSHSGRSMRHAGVVIGQAAVDLIEEAKRLAAEKFEVSVQTIEVAAAVCGVPGTDLRVSFAELAATQPEGVIRVERTNEMHQPVFPNGAAVCEVEIDADTGAAQITQYACVDDVGRCINPLIVHGQAHGAIVQGVGQAMGEAIVVDSASGQCYSGSFMDYRMPRASDLPMFATEIVEVLSPTNPLGVKSGGEGGTTPALAVYVAAIVDALKPYGVTDMALPVTAQSIFRAIHPSKS
ncbi:MAG: carbon-monoxide dehydrogenase large subunit [Gammaproteobacteria bacterium]|jgi:carbon-monoxide dehydrogenase large subunit